MLSSEKVPNTPTILVVDDDPDTRTLLCGFLSRNGFQPLSCGNGREALEMLESGISPRIVLLDLSMPVMGGERFMEALRSHTDYRDTAVVVLTGDDSARSRLSATGVEVLLKPSDPKSLMATLQRHVASC
jgi:CheY-like chemotaxis protein